MSQQDWWKRPRYEAHREVHEWVDHVRKQTQMQRMDTRLFLEIASNFNPCGDGAASSQLSGALRYKIRDNIGRAAVDTVASLVAQARTCPQYTTTDADWITSRRAMRRSWALQGQLTQLEAFDLVPRAFVDACESGTGYLVVGIQMDSDGKPHPYVERALPNEIYACPEDSRYGDPSVIARSRFASVGELEALCRNATDAGKIEDARGPTSQDFSDFFLRRDAQSKRKRVLEIWMRPTYEGGEDGRHILCTDNVSIVDEPWKVDLIPVIPVRYAERSQGYFGQSLVERMLPAQMRLAKLDHTWDVMLDLCATSYWDHPEGSCEKDQITNLPGAILTRSPDLPPPQLVTTKGVPPDILDQRAQIKQDAFDQEGISGAAAQGEVNKGLSSARAVRAADDVGSRRFIQPARLVEGAYLRLVKCLEQANDRCAEIDPEYTVAARKRAGRRAWTQSAKWSDLALDSRDTRCVMFPISATSALTPQAKWSALEEWIQAGFVAGPMALELMGIPDNEAFESEENANIDLVRAQVEEMLDDDGKQRLWLPVPPQAAFIDQCIKMVNLAWLSCWRGGAPDSVLARLEAYIACAIELKKKLVPPVSPQPEAGATAMVNQVLPPQQPPAGVPNV